MNGNNFGCIYSEENVATLRAAYEAGHTIGSHTWSHANIAELTDEQTGVELDKLEVAFWKILGIKPALFRPPYGSFNARNINYLNSRGYTVVYWDVDTKDSLGTSPSASMDIVLSETTSHSLILAHETIPSTPSTLTPQIIQHVQGTLGAKLVTADKCLDIEPYQAVGSYGTRDASWVC